MIKKIHFQKTTHAVICTKMEIDIGCRNLRCRHRKFRLVIEIKNQILPAGWNYKKNPDDIFKMKKAVCPISFKSFNLAFIFYNTIWHSYFNLFKRSALPSSSLPNEIKYFSKDTKLA